MGTSVGDIPLHAFEGTECTKAELGVLRYVRTYAGTARGGLLTKCDVRADTAAFVP